MRKPFWAGLAIIGLLLFAGAANAQNAPLPGQLAYREQVVNTLQPVQQRVIVPVREYRTETRLHGWWNPFREPQLVEHRVPTTRWEERIQTSYVPVPKREFRPVLETSYREAPPLQLAIRPPRTIARGVVQATDRRQLYDDLPLVALQAPPPGARTALVPSTTLAPQTFKPAARAPVNAFSPAPSGGSDMRGSTWSR
jgi:hypothetical protein